MLSDKAIEEFKQLYKEQYGEELTDSVAAEAANRLLRLVDIVYRPIPKDWEEKYEQIEQEQKAVPEGKKIDLVNHLVSDAKVSEFRAKVGEKKFWDLVVKANAAKEKMGSDQAKKHKGD